MIAKSILIIKLQPWKLELMHIVTAKAIVIYGFQSQLQKNTCLNDSVLDSKLKRNILRNVTT